MGEALSKVQQSELNIYRQKSFVILRVKMHKELCYPTQKLRKTKLKLDFVIVMLVPIYCRLVLTFTSLDSTLYVSLNGVCMWIPMSIPYRTLTGSLHHVLDLYS